MDLVHQRQVRQSGDRRSFAHLHLLGQFEVQSRQYLKNSLRARERYLRSRLLAIVVRSVRAQVASPAPHTKFRRFDVLPELIVW